MTDEPATVAEGALARGRWIYLIALAVGAVSGAFILACMKRYVDHRTEKIGGYTLCMTPFLLGVLAGRMRPDRPIRAALLLDRRGRPAGAPAATARGGRRPVAGDGRWCRDGDVAYSGVLRGGQLGRRGRAGRTRRSRDGAPALAGLPA